MCGVGKEKGVVVGVMENGGEEVFITRVVWSGGGVRSDLLESQF